MGGCHRSVLAAEAQRLRAVHWELRSLPRTQAQSPLVEGQSVYLPVTDPPGFSCDQVPNFALL